MSFDRELHGEQSEIGVDFSPGDGGRVLWGNMALMRSGTMYGKKWG